MKKLLILATSALVVCAYPALAEEGAATPPAATEQAPAANKPHGKPPGMMERADINKDGEITKEEFLANSEKMFSDMDGNSDGKITTAELDAKKEEWRKKMAELREQRRKLKEQAPPAQ